MPAFVIDRIGLSRPPAPARLLRLILSGSLIALLAAGAAPAYGAAVTNASTTVTPGPEGSNTATITATFSLRQGAQAGVEGGQKVVVTVNFWEDDTWPASDDFLGSTTVTVTMPASTQTTGPFTTPAVTIPTDKGSDFYAEVKASDGIGGASFVMAPSLGNPFQEEVPGSESALASLTPPRNVLQNPFLSHSYGQAVAIAAIQNTGDRRFLVLQPQLPSFPQVGFVGHQYIAKLGFTNSPETIPIGTFPTIVPEDTAGIPPSMNLTNQGRPVVEAFDVTDVPFSQIDRVIIAAHDTNGVNSDLEVLSAPLGAFVCPTNFDPSDVDRNGRVDVGDAIHVLRTIVGLPVG